MKRFLITAAATALGAGRDGIRAPAPRRGAGRDRVSAGGSELPGGRRAANCTIILTRSTALETLRDGVAYPHTVKQAGRIVAFTVGLSRLSSNRTTAHNDIHLLDIGLRRHDAHRDHRPAPGRRGALRHWKVVAESPAFHVQPYLGQVVQFPLTTSLPVATRATWSR